VGSVAAPEIAQPAHLWVPEHRESDGEEIRDLMTQVGRPLDPEQERDVSVLSALGPNGRALTLESCIVEARQNGKTGAVLLPIVLYDLFWGPPDRIVWTAHLFKTARDAFADFVGLIEGSDWLRSKVKKVSYSNGEEAIALRSGARLEFLARSKGGGRGLGGKRIVMDEALFLDSSAMAALLPTLSARSISGDPHIMYASSAELATSTQLRGLRERGRRGDDPSLIWIEYCAPGSWDNPTCTTGLECKHDPGEPGCALDDEANWKLANHALDRRISREYVRAERLAFRSAPREFGRERLGWHDEPEIAMSVFAPGSWGRCSTDDLPPEPTALGIASDLDQVWLSLGASSGGDKPHLGSVLRVRVDRDRDQFVSAVKRIQDERHCDVVVDAKGPASFIISDLDDADVTVTRTGLEDFVQACADIRVAVDNRHVTHGNYTELNEAVAAAGWRYVADRRVFARKDGDISMLEAVTLAYWAAAAEYDVLDSIG
jgi:hypothetical protein